MRLGGKVALITGAATGVEGELTGFGGASARLFAREGAAVMLSDVNEESGEKTAAQIRRDGGDVLFARLDVTRETDWERAISDTVARFGKLDILVNNAGIGGGRRGLEETTEEFWQAQMDVHAKGMFLGIKHVVPEMRKASGGSIINLSSIAGLIGMPLSTAYSAAKAANRLLTKAAAVQYASDNIRVNSVHPGYCVTPLTDKNFSDPEYGPRLLSTVPIGEFGGADDIASGILFLASDEASYVTGAELVIDGGVTAQ